MPRRFFIALLLCLITLTSFAATTRPCATQKTTLALNACWAKQLQAANTEMNETVTQLTQNYLGLAKKFKKMPALSRGMHSMSEQIAAIQHSFLNYRDVFCRQAVAARYQGGTFATVASTSCEVTLTRGFVNQLKHQFSN